MPTVPIRFTEQQLILLRHMAEETGDTRPVAEIVRDMFRDYARQMLGREYHKP
jgi:hypothetical protein